MRWTPLAALAATVTCLAGCQRETAIVVEIRAADPVAAEVLQLEVYVGVGRLDAPAPGGPSVTWWRQAPVTFAAADLALAAPLGDGTYRLALTPSADLALADEVVVAVAGRAPDADPVIAAYGHTAVLRFGDGLVRTVPLELAAPVNRSAAGVTATGCAWWADDPNATAAGPLRDHAIVPPEDADCDGYRVGAPGEVTDCAPAIDCDDGDPRIHPGAGETCTSGERDCCLATGPDADSDGDGYTLCQGDCLDSGAVDGTEAGHPVVIPAVDIHPGADDDTCDGVDQDCSGTCDDQLDADRDRDGFVSCGSVAPVDEPGQPGTPAAVACAPTAAVLDCDDDDPYGLPSAGNPEACDGVDFDCDQVPYAPIGRVGPACLDDSVGCRLGTLECGEELASHSSADTCVPLAAVPPLPLAACASCNGADPLDCDDGRFAVCEVFGAGTAQPCATPPQVVHVGTCVGGCQWKLLGGTQRAGWIVTLARTGEATPSTPVDQLDAADVELRVIQIGPAPTGFTVVIPALQRGSHTVLEPAADAVCRAPACRPPPG
ncbi:MAG: putative metal-binding motif-containing protein [Kofleriaceae bacterium]